MAFVISHPDLGVYIGECMNMCFWSALDPVGQHAACTFPTEAEANDYISRMAEWSPETTASNCILTEVQPDLGEFASISEIARVGLPAWAVH